ncbi:hypothetical protein Tco_0513504 [Tanacetum coccineum]
MGDENPIRTLGDYSKPSHEGYRNTIELPIGNNVVPLCSDTIRLVQNGCSFHGLRSEDPNQHLKDFLKLVDSLDLDGEKRKRTCLRSFTYITDFVVLEDIGEFIQINKAEVVMGFYAVLSSDLTNKITYRKFLIKNGEEIFTDAGDGVRIYPNGVASPAMTKKYVELSATEKLQADYDMNVINIILQGLPTEILFTCNSHRVAKDYGKKVQLLMQVNQQTHLAEFPQIDFGLAVPVFKQGDDPIDATNKMMSFLSTVVTSLFPSTNNQLRNSSNLRQQAAIHDGRVIV